MNKIKHTLLTIIASAASVALNGQTNIQPDSVVISQPHIDTIRSTQDTVRIDNDSASFLKETSYKIDTSLSIDTLIAVDSTLIKPVPKGPTIISGKIADATTGEGMPFVSIYFEGTNIGVKSDFDGGYKLQTNTPLDSLKATFIGYESKKKRVVKGEEQTLDFQLEPSSLSLSEVVVTSGENPAWPIMRRVIENKYKHDLRKLTAYQYDSYNKVELALDNITEKFRKRKVMRQIDGVFDSLKNLRGEDGREILPVFISESVSEFFYRTAPILTKEKILKTRVVGVGVSDGDVISQLIGSTFQQYNFYENRITVADKSFVSPIADGWKGFYKFFLNDSMMVDDEWCYQLDIEPKRKQDLAFYGSIWITVDEYALKQINLTVTKDANLNFIEKIKIQQLLKRVDSTVWLPAQTRIILDVGEITGNTAGLLAKFYSSNKNFTVNQPKEPNYYNPKIEPAEDMLEDPGDDFWQSARHTPLTVEEQRVFKMVDTLKKVPAVRTYVELVNILVSGYKKVSWLDIGPILNTYAWNSTEGSRIRVGFRTNEDFSKKIVFEPYLAYGTRDKRFKYGAELTYFISKKRWSEAGIYHKNDTDQVGLIEEEIEDSPLFAASARWGKLLGPFEHKQTGFWIRSEITKGLTPQFHFRQRNFASLFDFAYFQNFPDKSNPTNRFDITEAVFELRWARKEAYIRNGNKRVLVSKSKWPIFTFKYTHGIRDFLSGDIEYNRYEMGMTQKLQLGSIGKSVYAINAGYVPTTVPYPLLRVHIGNNSPFFNARAFNLMDVFEFVSDKYIYLHWTHHFDGFLANKIPLFKKLKWRFVASANFLAGSLSQENKDIIPATFNGTSVAPVGSLDSNEPYVEIGYGIENIFRFIKIDFIHRLTYLEDPEVRKFGVRFSVNFTL